jgi:hypothetical protein
LGKTLYILGNFYGLVIDVRLKSVAMYSQIITVTKTYDIRSIPLVLFLILRNISSKPK